ncbi:hypothetical protein [Aeromonas caviae]|uniref:hypothetical protein n=1 Tax=Aeromonas caviae TaxID=648 RepID=UPI003F746E32
MLFIDMIALVSVMIYISKRMRVAINGNNLIGFILNPMLYFVVFGLLYLLLGNIFVGLGAFKLLPTGLPINIDDKTYSKFYVDLFFLFIFIAYFFIKDKTGLKFQYIRYNKNNELFFIFISSVIFLFSIFIIFKFASTLLSLRDDRALVYEYFANEIYIPYRVGAIVNLYSAILIILGFSERKASRIFVLLPFFTFVILDLLQGGRSIGVRLGIVLYIIVVIRNNRFYLWEVLLAVIVVGFLPALNRITESNGLYAWFIAFGEFIFTRSTVDYVIYYNFFGTALDAVLKYSSSFLPGIVGTYFVGDSISYSEMISNISGLSWGLAGNIVSESIFYFGDFYLITVPVIVLTSSLFYQNLTLTRMPFLIVTIIYISNVQNIYRTSFYEFGLVMIYLMFSYLIVFTVLLWNKKIFK